MSWHFLDENNLFSVLRYRNIYFYIAHFTHSFKMLLWRIFFFRYAPFYLLMVWLHSLYDFTSKSGVVLFLFIKVQLLNISNALILFYLWVQALFMEWYELWICASTIGFDNEITVVYQSTWNALNSFVSNVMMP